jgi:hypothetical protein
MVNLTVDDVSDGNLHRFFLALPKKCVVVIADIDSAGIGREQEAAPQPGSHPAGAPGMPPDIHYSCIFLTANQDHAERPAQRPRWQRVSERLPIYHDLQQPRGPDASRADRQINPFRKHGPVVCCQHFRALGRSCRHCNRQLHWRGRLRAWRSSSLNSFL